MNYWLVKSEPSTYSFERLIKEKLTVWDGVRNYLARNNLKAMKLGELVLFYHSNEGKSVVGVAKVVKEAYPDPSINDERWVAIDIEAVKPLKNHVSLEQIKSDPELAQVALIKQSRLSVMPLNKAEFERIIKLGS